MPSSAASGGPGDAVGAGDRDQLVIIAAVDGLLQDQG
jgi:hypothetical protein